LHLLMTVILIDEVITHHGVDLHFPNDLWCYIPLHIPIGHFSVFIGNVQVIWLFFYWFLFSCLVFQWRFQAY
jgi:hypothetical protein